MFVSCSEEALGQLVAQTASRQAQTWSATFVSVGLTAQLSHSHTMFAYTQDQLKEAKEELVNANRRLQDLQRCSSAQQVELTHQLTSQTEQLAATQLVQRPLQLLKP